MESTLPQRIYDQIGGSIPLEIGFDKRASGTNAVRMTSPIPTTPVISYPVPLVTAMPTFDDVLTKSSIPRVNTLVTSQVSTPVIKGQAEIAAPPPPETQGCDGPQGMCPDELNQVLYDILTKESTTISCACETWDFYQLHNPSDGVFSWKTKQEFIHRTSDTANFEASSEYKLKYTRWGKTTAPKILLIHDVIDDRTGWWCAQRLLSPFFETLSVDLLGSGESTKPRGLNKNTVSTNDSAALFPWTFQLHAEYLIAMCRIMWPTEQFFVAGVGWGAQIAACMASMSMKGVGEAKTNSVAGIIMINPPNLSVNTHPEVAYSALYRLARISDDSSLCNTDVDFQSIIRDVILCNMHKKEITQTTLNLLLKQYERLDRKRILLEQLIATMNLQTQALPRTLENTHGLQLEKIVSPVMILNASHDLVYSPEQRHVYPAVYYNSVVTTSCLKETGHFAHIESYKAVAESIINFVRGQIGFPNLGEVFMGYNGSTQGNERTIMAGLKELYEIE